MAPITLVVLIWHSHLSSETVLETGGRPSNTIVDWENQLYRWMFWTGLGFFLHVEYIRHSPISVVWAVVISDYFNIEWFITPILTICTNIYGNKSQVCSVLAMFRYLNLMRFEIQWYGYQQYKMSIHAMIRRRLYHWMFLLLLLTGLYGCQIIQILYLL